MTKVFKRTIVTKNANVSRKIRNQKAVSTNDCTYFSVFIWKCLQNTTIFSVIPLKRWTKIHVNGECNSERAPSEEDKKR